jgi:hypothetical protein
MTTMRGSASRIHLGRTMDCRAMRGNGKTNDKGKTDG